MPQLVGKEVGPIGFGLMGFTWRPNPLPVEKAVEAMREALERGMNLWNGGEFYGTPEYNSLHLLERYFEQYPDDADRVVLSIKGAGGCDGRSPNGSPQEIRRSLDCCIALLKGRKKIDIFECARRDQNTPMQITFGALEKEYVETGKIGGIALSEVRASTIHEAVKITNIVAVEVELSLFGTDVLDNGVAEACKQYDIPLIAYSPLGRGILTGKIKSLSDLPADSILRGFPRFQPDTFPINVKLVHRIEEVAKKKGVTPAQLAINWTIAISRRPTLPTVIPIPGATTVERVAENAKTVDITEEELASLDEILKSIEIAGARYPPYVPTDT